MVVLISVQRHLFSDEPLDVAQIISLVLLVTERNGNAFSTCTPRPADAVHIGFWDVWDFEVDDMTEVVDVDAPGSNVCGDEHPQITPLEGFHRLFPLGLRLVAVYGFTPHALLPEVSNKLVCTVLRPREHQCTCDIWGGEYIHKEVFFFCLTHEKDLLFDGFSCGAAPLDFHGDGVMQNGVC